MQASMKATRLAYALWIAWAVIVWNVVFDYALVVAGRLYVHAAAAAAQNGVAYARMDEWMRPAVVRGVWMASAAAGAVLLIGVIGVRLASGGKRRPAP